MIIWCLVPNQTVLLSTIHYMASNNHMWNSLAISSVTLVMKTFSDKIYPQRDNRGKNPNCIRYYIQTKSATKVQALLVLYVSNPTIYPSVSEGKDLYSGRFLFGGTCCMSCQIEHKVYLQTKSHQFEHKVHYRWKVIIL